MTTSPAEPIRSATNPRFRLLAGLVEKPRERRRQGASVIEGAHLLESFVARFGAPRLVFVPEDAPSSVARLAGASGAEVLALDRRLFARVSEVENGPGPIAVVDTPRSVLPGSIVEDLVYLDRIQDPGNVGSILRSCAAVGVSRILAAPATAACWSPKVLRAAMGAHFHLQIHEGVDLQTLRGHGAIEFRAADASASLGLYDAELRAPAVWLLGNEGQGLDAAIGQWPEVVRVAIPQSAAVESLNVGVAAALCLYEQWRQRRRSAPAHARSFPSSSAPRA